MNPLLVIVGPSGSGKNTVCEFAGLSPIVSHTTRAPRNGEVNGVDYHFVNRATFAATSMVESMEYDYQMYGTSVAEFEGRDCAVVEPNGALALKHHCELVGRECIIVGLTAPDEVRSARMLGRGDSAKDVERRLTGDATVFSCLEELCDVVFDTNEVPIEKICEYIESRRTNCDNNSEES